jgi:hypothetical protein
MQKMLREIRTIIADYLKFIVLSDVVAGEIISVNPLKIRIDENFILTNEFIYCSFPIPPKAINQSVQLHRQVGGQKFHILPKQFWR